MKTTAIGAADLLALIEREFRRREPRKCPWCFASMPFRVAQADPRAANWQIVPLGECPQRCAAALDEVVSDLQRRYRLSGNALA